MNKVAPLMLLLLSACSNHDAIDTSLDNTQKEPNSVTKAFNDDFLASYSLDDTNNEDFDNADKGFIASIPDDKMIICKGDGNTVSTVTDCNEGVVWNLQAYQELLDNHPSEAPDSINPSLWRNFSLNMKHGLYQVVSDPSATLGDKNIVSGIYQVRGFDLSNITFIKTPDEDAWLVLDPLISKETAAAALEFINSSLGVDYPVAGVLYSHSHIDHFGGVKGLFTVNDPNGTPTSNPIIFAPEDFTEHAVSENVIAGNAMGRRAIYMYGALTGVDEEGKTGVGSGLGLTNSTGESTLIPPTHIITQTTSECPPCIYTELGGPRLVQDDIVIINDNIEWKGLKMQFQMTPGTEAPSEMNTYFANWDALWMAENTTNTMHNILTLRGALVRDPLIWSQFLTETIDRWGDSAQVKFQSHHWPLWQESNITEYLEKQRDTYKYIHDQTVRLMNAGYIGEEISEQLTLPSSLEQNWATRGYYGTLSHNSRAVYQRYMGWYTGNPSDLNNLPPESVAVKYVEYMGGAAEIIERVKDEHEGLMVKAVVDLPLAVDTYRWAAEVLKHVIFAGDTISSDSEIQEAKYLLADVYEQLGYMSESGPWRAEYLQGAYELRNTNFGSGGLTTASADIIANMSLPMVFDFWAVQLDPDKIKNLSSSDYPNGMIFNFELIDDVDEEDNNIYTLTVNNAVLNYTPNEKNVVTTVKIDKDNLDFLLAGHRLCDPGAASDPSNPCAVNDIDGTNLDIMDDFIGLLTPPQFWFPIVTPRSEGIIPPSQSTTESISASLIRH